MAGKIGSFHRVDDLEATFRAYIDSDNTRATPFIRTKTAEHLIGKIKGKGTINTRRQPSAATARLGRAPPKCASACVSSPALAHLGSARLAGIPNVKLSTAHGTRALYWTGDRVVVEIQNFTALVSRETGARKLLDD